MSREKRRAADLTEDTCVFLNYDRGEQVRVVMSAYTINGKTTVVFNDGEPIRVGSDVPFNLATQQEVEEADAQADRTAFAAALDRFADRVVQARLPVPHRDQRLHISFDLDRDQDVQHWSRWLASNPQQGTSRLVVLAEVEGVEVMVRGPEGSTAEFGPDFADVALAQSVEHRDSVGAFPVVAKPSAQACLQAERDDAELRRGGAWGINRTGCTYEPDCPLHGEKPKPAPDGWPISDGHRPPVDEDAMRADRYNGEG